MRTLSPSALTLLRRLASHEEALVTMRRVYPSEPRYRVRYEADKKDVGLRWRDEPTDEAALADLAMVHAVTLTSDRREEGEDVREWGISARGREILARGGLVADAEPEPPMLFADDTGRKQRGIEHG